ncbi:hypothetical protein SKAU_G00033530 [Synaphobranchus kaupii]|uniref:Tetratricopeptide repeat protein 31 n=1 Tax=Synaphobranchus kaupii TaxID=118154 RepID=A0A9Q1JFI3_SYNKA|nr:hypothetical protein SKAU_G00033530 [Synaphobranchus kaupii]
MSQQNDIVSKDFVPGLGDTAELYDPHVMQAYEKMMDLIKAQSEFDPLESGFFDLDFPNEYYINDDDYMDDDINYEDQDERKAYCGFSRNFLDQTSAKAGSPPFPSHVTHLPHLSYVPYTPGFRTIRPTSEEAERNAQELLEEEEQMKEKAEKKRLKKIKQKERKRQEKLKKEIDIGNKDVKDDPKVEVSSMKPVKEVHFKSNKQDVSRPVDSDPPLQKSESPAPPIEKQNNSKDLSEEEDSEAEELDMTSSFVSKAAIIAKRKLELRSKPEKKEKNKPTVNQPKEKPKVAQVDQHQNGAVHTVQDVILKSTELAVIGNKLASTGCFELAVRYFTDAIKCNPKEFRLFGNRSFCYEKMHLYERSLTDAEISLTMCPNWIKGLYRKGRALAGLKRYREAAMAFKELLKVDNTCIDAAQELMAVQIIQLMDLGLTREQSSNALIIHGTVEKALEALSNIPDVKLLGLPAARATQSAAMGKKDPLQPSTPAESSPAKTQPQPALYPVWVGNVIPSISENMIRRIFSTVGEIYSLKVLRARRCAFINYTRDEYCQRAISDIHGMEVEGASLLVRYPDRLHTHLGMSRTAHPAAGPPKTAPKSTGECFFWRNNGCVKKENCFYRHVPEHKGIDRTKGQISAPCLTPPHLTAAASQ